MNKTIPALLIPIVLSLSTTSLYAADENARVGSFGFGVGTGGLGVDYAYPLHKYLDIRAGYDFGSLNRDEEEEGIEYEAELKFSAARLLADYKPFGGGFRISAGLYTGSPELELKASGEDQYDVGEREYNGDIDILGDIDLGSTAPYLGIGWGGTAGTTGFGVSFDLGVLFTDSPKVGLTVPRGRACDATDKPDCDPNGPGSFDVAADDPSNPTELSDQFRADVEQERADLEDDAKDFELWPIIRLGLHYRF